MPDTNQIDDERKVPKRSASFTEISERYDKSRYLPSNQFKDAIIRLSDNGLLPQEARILDIGCGTGQISLPLAQIGYDVTGTDISPAMVQIACSKIRQNCKIRFVVGDAQSLEFGNCLFDCTVASKLFQHISNWKLAVEEIIRVTKPGGRFFHINERGAFRSVIRKKFEILADKLGYQNRYLGVINRDELREYFQQCGCRYKNIDLSDLKWQKKITFGEALQEFKERMFAEFWDIPKNEYKGMIEDVDRWIKTQPNGYKTIEYMQPYLMMDIFTTPTIDPP